MKRWMSMILALCMVVLLFPTSSATAGTQAESSAALEERMKEVLFSAETQTNGENGEQAEEALSWDEDEVVRVIVELSQQPALESMSVESVQTAASAETAALKSQEATIYQVERTLGLEPVHRMGYIMNTVSYDVRRGDIDALRAMPGVVSVTEAVSYQPEMVSAKEIAQVYEAWKLGDTGYTGKEMVIAVIDSGVNYLHEDMVQDVENAKYTKADMEKLISQLGHGQWFSDKVPYGYCYVTGHNDILNGVSRHGYHVSGIAAANGDEASGGIAGVAPDAQILAMQVYEGYTGEGGYSDDIICAIEDAVKLGADVINMSLGIDAGFYGSDSYISRATDYAEEAGVFVSVSAGNAAISSEGDKQDQVITNDWYMADVGTVGDPATAAGATAVASVDSYGYVTFHLTIAPEGGEAKQLSGIQLSSTNFNWSMPVDVVDCGTGGDEGLRKTNAQNNLALVAVPQYDDLETLREKLYESARYADMYGWRGVMFYSADEGGAPGKRENDLAGLIWNNFLFYVDHETGAYLLGLSEAQTKVTVSQYEGFAFASEAVEENASSYFTAWGTTSTLDIKPELAAPGGSVLSVEGGTTSYAQMSGTSMAAPFVAGSAAVVKQMLVESGISVEDIPDFIRTTLMNTAVPVNQYARDSIAPVRQVGAGLIQVDAAVQNRVLATYNGKAAIELRDKLENQTTGEIVLTNYGDTPATYSLSATDVYTDYTDPITKEYYDIALSGASITFDSETVTVPAGGKAKVSFTIHLPRLNEGHFVEGYIQLISETENAPALSMPYLGFMGDWDAEPIVDEPEWENDTVIPIMDYGYYGVTSHGTCLLTNRENTYTVLGEVVKTITRDSDGMTIPVSYVDPDRIAISPNGDGFYDIAVPWLGLLRNAKEIQLDVLDSQGNVIARPGSVYNLSKLVNGALSVSQTHGVLMANNGSAPFWDGMRYNQSTGSYEIVPEGDYTVRIRSKVREDGAWQTVTMPVRVDLTPPEITYFSAERVNSQSVHFEFQAPDEAFIASSVVLSINGELFGWDIGWFEYDESTGIYSYDQIWPNGVYVEMDEPVHVAVMIADDAGNYTMRQTTVGGEETESFGLVNLFFDETNFVGNVDSYQIMGFAPEGSVVTFNGEEAAMDQGNFSYNLILSREVTMVKVEIVSPDGETLLSQVATVHACGNTPQFGAVLLDDAFPADYYGTYQSDPYTGSKTNHSVFILNEDYGDGTEFPMRVKIAHPGCTYVTLKNIETQEVTVLTPGEDGYVPFTMVLDGETGCAGYLLTLEGGGQTVMTNIQVWNHTPGKEQEDSLNRDYVPCYWNLSSVTYVNSEMLQEDGTFRIYGYLYNPVDRLTVDGKEAVMDPETLEWYCDVQLEVGTNRIPIVSEEGGYFYEQTMHKIIFTDGPVLSLELPEPAADGVYYVEQDTFELRGTVATALDDAVVYVNDSQVLSANNSGHGYGQAFITRDFAQTLQLDHGNNVITVTAYDPSGIYTTEVITLNYCPSNGKTDVNHDAWYHEGIDFCLQQGLMVGTGDDTFAPEHNMTRGQLITVLYRLSGETVSKNAPNPFEDVNPKAFYGDAVRWGYANGIVQGTTATKFAPNAPVTREQLAVMLSRYADCTGVLTPDGVDLSDFADANRISPYAQPAMSWAVAKGLLVGTSTTTLSPKGTATRAQLATVLMRFYTLAENS